MDASLRLFDGKIHIGGRRSPIRDVLDLRSLLNTLSAYPALSLGGMMIYEGQVAGLGDNNPVNFWINPFVRMMKKISVRRLATLKDAVTAELASLGLKLPLFNGGGTGSLPTVVQAKHLTEITVGSAFMSPTSF